MKLLSFHYHLKINMDAPVSGHHFTLRCIPVSDQRQKIVNLQHYVFPEDYLSRGTDQWGNALLCGLYHGQHTGFEANICGQAVTGLSGGTPARDYEKERIFCFETPLTKADGALKEFADGLRTGAGAPEAERGLRISSGEPEEAEAVMHAVHGALVYTPGATTVRTTAAEAFALGKGVCQDYAHIMLAVLRAKRIPARYVAGMLLGEGESHAWVEVLHEGIWTPYDPTNDLVVTDQHIKLSHGRDEVIFLNARCSGMFMKTRSQGTWVKKGETIGYVFDPLKGEIMEYVSADKSGLLFTIRDYPLVDEGSLMGRILVRGSEKNEREHYFPDPSYLSR